MNDAIERPDGKLVPSHVKMDTTMELILAPEMQQLLQDLHKAQDGIVMVAIVLLGCYVAKTLKHLFGSSPAK